MTSVSTAQLSRMNDIQLICFDLDKTLIDQSSWYKLNLALGITHEQDQAMVDAYLRNEFNYVEWTKKILQFYKKSDKANRTDMRAILSDYQFVPGAVETVTYLQAKGYKVALISGSVDMMVNLAASDLNVDFAEACNTLVFDEAGRLTDLIPCVSDISAKLDYLQNICDRLGIDITQCACVGDGDNDVALSDATGHGITFTDSHIKDNAWKVITALPELKELF